MNYLENNSTCYWQINQKNGNITLRQDFDVLVITYSDINGTKETFKLSLEHFDKMVSYKTIHHALNYARKHQLAETEQTLTDSESSCPSHSEATNVAEGDTLSTPNPIEFQTPVGIIDIEGIEQSSPSKEDIINIDFPRIWIADKSNADENRYFLLDNEQQLLIENLLEKKIIDLKNYVFLNLSKLSECKIKLIVSAIIKCNQLLFDLQDCDSEGDCLIAEFDCLIAELKSYGVSSSCFEGIV